MWLRSDPNTRFGFLLYFSVIILCMIVYGLMMILFYQLSTRYSRRQCWPSRPDYNKGLLLWWFDTVFSSYSQVVIRPKGSLLKWILVQSDFREISLWAKGAVGPYIEGQLGFPINWPYFSGESLTSFERKGLIHFLRQQTLGVPDKSCVRPCSQDMCAEFMG